MRKRSKHNEREHHESEAGAPALDRRRDHVKAKREERDKGRNARAETEESGRFTQGVLGATPAGMGMSSREPKRFHMSKDKLGKVEYKRDSVLHRYSD